VGLSLLCALAFTAFSAASASAATSGTTAFTCVDTAPTNNGDYTDAHCDTTGTLGASRYKHEALAANPTTNVISTNAATKNSTTEASTAVLEATVFGFFTKLESSNIAASGTLENKLTGQVHEMIGSGITITYTGVTVAAPANCQVHSPGQAAGTIVTNTLKSESVEGTPMTQKFSPAAGTEFVKLEFENKAPGTCNINGQKPVVTGTVSAEPSGQMAAGGGKGASAGATLNVNVTKASAQLKVGGQNASLTALETIKMSGGNPIVSTGPPF